MKTAWAWLKRWWGAIAGGLLVVLASVGLWRHERGKRLSAEAAAEVNDLRAKIAKAKAIREGLIEDADEHDEAIAVLDQRIEERERAILNAHDEPLEGLTRDEIREKLRSLGF